MTGLLMAPKLHKTATTATATENCGRHKDKHISNLTPCRSSSSLVLHSHTDLHCCAVFLLKRLEAHAEKGEAAGQVGLGIFGVSASVRAIERVFSQTFLC